MQLSSMRVAAVLVLIASHMAATGGVLAQEASISAYGTRNAAAPAELDAFAFLVGKWKGVAKTRLENGNYTESDIIWIGRYVLDGMAIVDEGHGVGPGGATRVGGYTLRYFDPNNKSWNIEFVNVGSSFVRRQVNQRTGSVSLEGASVVVSAADGTTMFREYYDLSGKNSFVYRIHLSHDGGKNWDTGLYEATLARVE